jgi:hypothetical protein
MCEALTVREKKETGWFETAVAIETGIFFSFWVVNPERSERRSSG